MTVPYTDSYYARQVGGALRSARAVVPLLAQAFRPTSVADFGCGQGAWLRAWREAGVEDVVGFDGSYVSVDRLQFPVDRFRPVDLSKPVLTGRSVAFSQSLEVAEHLPADSSDLFVSTLVSAAPIVLFSAAVPGQGGESHINEQPLEAWRRRFATHGYRAFDFLRPLLHGVTHVEPWYRYNSILYVREDHIASLSEAVVAAMIPAHLPIAERGSVSWNIRRAIVSLLPRSTVDGIARALARSPIRAMRTGEMRNDT